MRAEDLRGVIRELLAEELARLRAASGTHADTRPRPQVREEQVSIRGDADLAAFVQRLAAVMKNGEARAQIESGRWVFRLAPAGPLPPSSVSSPAADDGGAVARFERGLVSEREVQTLPAGTTRVMAGKRVRFTPLATDALRRRGITLHRSDP